MRLIRKMSAEDIDAVSRLEAENFSMPWKKADFEKALMDKQSLYLVAEEDGAVAGVCGVRNILGEGEISNVSVKEQYRRSLIAYEMLSELIRQGREIGILEYTLEVRSGNDGAIRLYEKLGFRKEGLRKNFYEKPTEDATILWKRQEKKA